MKNKFFRRAAVLTAALFSFTCMSATAYAQSNEPVAETEPPAAEETTTKPFTPDGTGTVVDNATDEDGKEFFTITTPSENIFYLVIDRQRTENNVYFLNAVTEKDLLALAEADPEPEVTEPVVQPEPDPEPVPEPEPEPEKDTAFPVGNLLMVAAVRWWAVVRPTISRSTARSMKPLGWTRTITTTMKPTPMEIWRLRKKRRTRNELYQQPLRKDDERDPPPGPWRR